MTNAGTKTTSKTNLGLSRQKKEKFQWSTYHQNISILECTTQKKMKFLSTFAGIPSFLLPMGNTTQAELKHSEYFPNFKWG